MLDCADAVALMQDRLAEIGDEKHALFWSDRSGASRLPARIQCVGLGIVVHEGFFLIAGVIAVGVMAEAIAQAVQNSS